MMVFLSLVVVVAVVLVGAYANGSPPLVGRVSTSAKESRRLHALRAMRLRGGATSLVSQIQENFSNSHGKFDSAESLGEFVEISFEGGSKYRFHAEWLRDACRDESFVKHAAGERLLHRIQLVQGTPSEIKSTSAEIDPNGVLQITFDTNEICTYTAEMLQAYASKCAKHLGGPTIEHADIDWLLPFNGVGGADAQGPDAESLSLWRGQNGGEIPIIQWSHVMTPEGNLAMLKHLLGGHGAVKIQGVSSPGTPALHRFIDYTCGGLQKDPSRQEANWLIVRKETAASVSYNPATRLNNHSDQSLPNHGIPGLFLVMHYAEGWGANTIVDGFAAAEDLRREDPQAFEMLSKYGNDQERDLIASRQHTASLCVPVPHKRRAHHPSGCGRTSEEDPVQRSVPYARVGALRPIQGMVCGLPQIW